MTMRSMGIQSLMLLILIWIHLAGSEEYCNSDVFKPVCGNDEVVLIEKAEFGRMSLGKCVTKNASGCKANAHGILDSKCSGRRTCEVRVAMDELEDISTCDQEYKSYLDVEYRCLPVHSATKHQCQIPTPVAMTQTSGYLPYIITEETGCGADNNRWVLEARPGQTLNFTLYDFTWGLSDEQHRCTDIYAVITEPLANNRKEVCGRDGRRVSHELTTVSHKAEVLVYPKPNRPDRSYFLLFYQVVGCPDPQLGARMTFQRSGSTAVITCVDRNNRQWTVTCENGRWTGNHDNCSNTAAVIGNTGGQGSNAWMPFPLDVSLALVAGVAFVVGCCIFVVGIFILKRNNFNEERKRQNTILLREAQDLTFGKYPAHPDPSDPEFKIHPTLSSENRSMQGQPIENEYAYVTDFPPPPSPKTLRMCGSGGNKDHSHRTKPPSKQYFKNSQVPCAGKASQTKDCYQMRMVDPQTHVVVPEPYFELDHSSSDRRNSS